jgi:O-antigen ligase
VALYTPIAVADRRQSKRDPIGAASIERVSAASSARARLRALPGGAVLAAAVPFVYLNVAFQPSVDVGVGSASVTATLADVAVLAVIVVAAMRGGYARLRAATLLWATAGAFVAWTFAASLYPRAWNGEYASLTHLVTAAKFAEYALLAPAVALLVRTRRDLDILVATLVVLSVPASAIAVAQYFGLDIFRAWPAGERQPSFLGIHELGSYSAAVLALGLASILWPPRERRARVLATIAVVSGCIGLVLSGAAAAALGALLAAGALVVVGWRRGVLDPRRLAAGAAVVAVFVLGFVAIRSGDIAAFGRFVGAAPENEETATHVQTYAHRTLMMYLGVEMWRDHPVLGVGWQGVREETNWRPHLADAHARFPDQPDEAFPSRAHAYGIDNAFVQALAELGAVGLLLFVAFLATAVVAGFFGALRAPEESFATALVGFLLVLVAVGTWAGQGLVAGASFDATAWIGVGLVAAARAGERGCV